MLKLKTERDNKWNAPVSRHARHATDATMLWLHINAPDCSGIYFNFLLFVSFVLIVNCMCINYISIKYGATDLVMLLKHIGAVSRSTRATI